MNNLQIFAGWKKFQLINGDPFVKMEDFGLDPDHIKRFLELILPSKGMEEGLIFDRILRVCIIYPFSLT